MGEDGRGQEVLPQTAEDLGRQSVMISEERKASPPHRQDLTDEVVQETGL